MGIGKGGRDHSHIRYLHNYLFKRPPTRSRKKLKKNTSRWYVLGSINLGFSLKKLTLQVSGIVWFFAVDRGCFELFLSKIRRVSQEFYTHVPLQ